MNKIELILFSVMLVFTSAVGFDYIVFIIKSGAKTSYFTKGSWRVAMLFAMALTYWYFNGMKFL